MSHNLCVSCVLCMVVVMVVSAGVEVLAETGGNSYLLCPACVRPRNSQPRVGGEVSGHHSEGSNICQGSIQQCLLCMVDMCL